MVAVSEADRFQIINMPERRPADLEDRVARVEAKEAIFDVMMQYGHYCDVRDWDTLMKLYTDDIERVLTGTLDERVQGKAKLLELYINPVLPTKDGVALGAAAPPATAQETTIRHMFAAPVIRLADDGKEAWLTSYFSLVRSVDSDSGFERHVHEGTYIFTFVKQGEDWKIKKMVVSSEIGHDPGFRPSGPK